MTTYEQRLHRFFDLSRTNAAYIQKGVLTQTQFDQAIKDTVKIRRLYLPGLDWLLMDQLLSAFRHISLLDHCEALSAGLGREFEGIEDLYRVMIDIEIVPPWVLNRTKLHRIPQEIGLLGNLLEELGIISGVDLQRALGIKEIIHERTGLRIALGQMFRSFGHLSIVDFMQALGLQVGIPFEGLDESAPQIWSAASRRYKTIPPPSM